MSASDLTASDLDVLHRVAQHDHEAGQWYLRFRNVAEWPLVALMCLVALPVVVVVAILAKLTSPGPAFYTQTRLGRHGRPFTIYKIRTMKHNCESATGAVWCAPNDDRMTRIGRFLRDTHLDELPQLFNVLQGHMSLIGPRPERPEMVARVARDLKDYHKRLLVRPGLTGLAQVRLPADLDVADVRHKLAYDLYYVRKVSLMMDLRVSFATALHLAALCADAVSSVVVKRYADDIERELIAASGGIGTGALSQQTAPASNVAAPAEDAAMAAAVAAINAAAAATPEPSIIVTSPVTPLRAPSVRAAIAVRRAHASSGNGNGNGSGNGNGNGETHEHRRPAVVSEGVS